MMKVAKLDENTLKRLKELFPTDTVNGCVEKLLSGREAQASAPNAGQASTPVRGLSDDGSTSPPREGVQTTSPPREGVQTANPLGEGEQIDVGLPVQDHSIEYFNKAVLGIYEEVIVPQMKEALKSMETKFADFSESVDERLLKLERL